MDLASRTRNCSKCQLELVNSTGVHMGIPFGHWTYRDGIKPSSALIIVCAKCYDVMTVKNNMQITGEEVI